MISVKDACRNKWFPDQDSNGLCSIANEILSNFCSIMNFATEPTSFLSIISTIMSRYCPKMKMGEILAFLEIKPGYGTYVHDFTISINRKLDERIRLFVAQVDNTETSSCLITPAMANFLLNGRGVDRRNNISMDTGPQMPTVVYPLLRYGTNLLQAVGQFSGNYVVVAAFMSMVSTPDHCTLQDYVQPSVATDDSDSELIEGPSRISLNCPISFKRINVPVKGHMCKHLQCFDYENYMEINSRRPSWRCPHCNQHVCFSDIRIDQNIAKILKEVGESVNDVIISSDFSWKVVMEYDEHRDELQDNTTSGQHETAEPKSSGFTNSQTDVLDITVDDYEVDTFKICEVEDRIVSSTNCRMQSDQNMTANSHMEKSNELNQIEDNFLSGIILPTYASGASSPWSGSQIGFVSEPSLDNLLSPILDGGANHALSQEPGRVYENALNNSSTMLSHISSSNSLLLQQFQPGNTAHGNEYGQFSALPRHGSRTPTTVQARVSATPTSVLPQMPTSTMNTVIPNCGSTASRTSASSFPSNNEGRQLFSRTNSNPLQVASMNSSTSQRYPGSQSVRLQAPRQMQNSHTYSSVVANRSSGERPIINTRAVLNQSPGPTRQSASVPHGQTYQGGSQNVIRTETGTIAGGRRVPAMVSAPHMSRPVQTSRAAAPCAVNTDGHGTSNGDLQANTDGVGQTITRTHNSVDLPAEQDWRPTGRMRGSLSGRAYCDAYNQFIVQPTLQGTTTRPTSNVASRSLSTSQMDILLANRTALAEAGTNSYSLSRSRSSVSGFVPDGSSRMN